MQYSNKFCSKSVHNLWLHNHMLKIFRSACMLTLSTGSKKDNSAIFFEFLLQPYIFMQFPALVSNTEGHEKITFFLFMKSVPLVAQVHEKKFGILKLIFRKDIGLYFLCNLISFFL